MTVYGDRVKQFKPKSGDSAVELLFRILQANDALAVAAPSGPGATEAKQDDIITALGGLALELTVDQINLNTDELEKNVWDSIAGNSIEFTYYTDTGGGANPSGNKNIETAIYKTGVATIVTKTFVWDADDDVLSITAV